jgi:hypothetical protein
MVWYGMVWYGMVWYGMVYDMAWYGMVWCVSMCVCQHHNLKISNVSRGIFFLYRVFAMKSVQTRKTFWRTSQNCFILALFSSFYCELPFKMQLKYN